jgi:hypothetical protein
MAQQLQDRVTHKKQELVNSWNRWSSAWNWASWLLPLTGPLLMLPLALVVGPCSLNAITHFISSRMEAAPGPNIGLWDRRSLMESLKFSAHACSQVGKASRGGNEEEHYLRQG